MSEVAEYFPPPQDYFTPLRTPLGYKVLPLGKDSAGISEDRKRFMGECILWDNNWDHLIDDVTYFENRTLISMNYTFDIDISYEGMIAVYSNRDRVPILVGGAI